MSLFPFPQFQGSWQPIFSAKNKLKIRRVSQVQNKVCDVFTTHPHKFVSLFENLERYPKHRTNLLFGLSLATITTLWEYELLHIPRGQSSHCLADKHISCLGSSSRVPLPKFTCSPSAISIHNDGTSFKKPILVLVQYSRFPSSCQNSCQTSVGNRLPTFDYALMIWSTAHSIQ